MGKALLTSFRRFNLGVVVRIAAIITALVTTMSMTPSRIWAAAIGDTSGGPTPGDFLMVIIGEGNTAIVQVNNNPPSLVTAIPMRDEDGNLRQFFPTGGIFVGSGDVLLTEPPPPEGPGGDSDILRFHDAGFGFGDFFTLYSDDEDQNLDIADVPRPTALAPTVVIDEMGPEGNNGAIYTAGKSTYIITSDVPEPASVILIVLGLLAIATFRWKMRCC